MLILVALFALAAAANAEFGQKIVGGGEAVHGDHPYICSLQRRTLSFLPFSHSCGAVIWNRNFVVTAAHCLGGSVSNSRLVCGTHSLSSNDAGQQTASIAEFILHPGYDESGAGYPNDIALLRLSSPLTYSSTIGAFPLASSGSFLGQSCTLSGWGRLVGGGSLPDKLQKVNLNKISNEDCASRWSSVSGAAINNGHICFYQGSGLSACNGDSGGPVRCDDTITGVTSWGIQTCDGTYPSVYTRVSTFYDWLKGIAQDQELHSSFAEN